jgi:hypothetical protein
VPRDRLVLEVGRCTPLDCGGGQRALGTCPPRGAAELRPAAGTAVTGRWPCGPFCAPWRELDLRPMRELAQRRTIRRARVALAVRRVRSDGDTGGGRVWDCCRRARKESPRDAKYRTRFGGFYFVAYSISQQNSITGAHSS